VLGVQHGLRRAELAVLGAYAADGVLRKLQSWNCFRAIIQAT
jgi:hypothetical protein